MSTILITIDLMVDTWIQHQHYSNTVTSILNITGQPNDSRLTITTIATLMLYATTVTSQICELGIWVKYRIYNYNNDYLVIITICSDTSDNRP